MGAVGLKGVFRVTKGTAGSRGSSHASGRIPPSAPGDGAAGGAGAEDADPHTVGRRRRPREVLAPEDPQGHRLKRGEGIIRSAEMETKHAKIMQEKNRKEIQQDGINNCKKFMNKFDH